MHGGFVILSGSWLWTQPREVLQVKGLQCLFPETGLSGWSCLAQGCRDLSCGVSCSESSCEQGCAAIEVLLAFEMQACSGKQDN